MYQSIKSEGLATPVPGPTLRPVEVDGAYTGPERRRSTSTSGLLADINTVLVLDWLRRFWIAIAVAALMGALLGMGAGVLLKPRFTSYSDLLLDPTHLQVMANDLYTSNLQGEAQLLEVESKMRILTSTSVLARVVRDLDLENDPRLMEPEFPLLANLLSSGDTKGDSFTAAMRALSERVQVQREERSYVVTASTWARTPERSAELTNALVNAFLAELAATEAEGARSVSSELNQRLEELRDDAAAAEAAVVDYRRLFGLQLTGTDQLSAQSAVQLNTQIADARQNVIEAEARYAGLTAGNTADQLSAAAQVSPLLANLRTQYATARQQVDSLSATLGQRHPRLATARAELNALQGEIDREVERLLQNASNDLDRARSVLDQLNQAAADQMGEVFSDDHAQVQLRQLERTADSKVAIYEAYLMRAQQIAERSELNTSNVRVISAALPPISRSYPPRTVLLIAVGLVGGMMLGTALAVALGLRHLFLSNRPRTRDA